MKIVHSICLSAVLWLCLTPLARADNATPVSPVTPTPVSMPSPPPPAVTDTPIPVMQPPPVSDATPLTVAREHNTPVSTINAPLALSPTAGPETQPTQDTLPGTHLSGRNNTTLAGSSPSNSGVPGSTGTGLANSSGTGPLSPSGIPGLGTAFNPVSSQAPSQLACHRKRHPNASPFLASPYSGWTEVVSFVDHDSPDYTVDGKIVLANGLTATAVDGQASDLFPAYWSPALRQYVNYDGHNGYDFGINYQPVLAAAGGSVAYAGWNESDPYSGYGQMVLINHHNGYVTLYGHLSKLEVQTGDAVTQGQEIGISGTTGHSSGPHLHFSVFHDCKVTDPYGWTGKGADPLTAFDGQTASYLWLPARDPLLLNPPPDWPAYPSGLRLSIPASDSQSLSRTRGLPPADRLLLLSLPPPSRDGAVTPGAALARTEARITQEGNVLEPQLNDLVHAGAIDNYEVIPAAGAIWVRGRATAAQLESLPGVASLTGVEPSDLDAAQAGLAHAVLIQIGQQRAPSLWPVGFRSGLHAWRSVTTVVNGDPLVAGFALPGARVVVSLRRGNSVPAAAATTTDATSGGFVTTLHDAAGNPIAVRTGDVVEFASGGRTTRMLVSPLTVSARGSHVEGVAPRGSTISIAAVANERQLSASLASSQPSGHFVLSFARRLPAGSLVVGSIMDSAGNQESAAGFVPGMDVTEGSNDVRGWTVGRSPRLVVTRGARVIFVVRLLPSADGSFDVALQRHGRPVVLHAGDTITIGSSSHGHTVHLGALTSHLKLGMGTITIAAPRGAAVTVQFIRASGDLWTRTVTLMDATPAALNLPSGAASTGDSVLLRYVTSHGDIVEAVDELHRLTVHRGTSIITGRVRPGALLSFRVIDAAGAFRGVAIAGADSRTGEFRAMVVDATGRPSPLFGPIHVIMREGGVSTTFYPPQLTLKLNVRTGSVTGRAPAHALLTLSVFHGGVTRSVRRVSASASGVFRAHVIATELSVHSRLTVTLSLTDGLAVVRTTEVRQSVSAAPRGAERPVKCGKHADRPGACRRHGIR